MQDNAPNGKRLLLSLKFFAVLLAIITIADCIILAAALEDIDGRSALFMFTFFSHSFLLPLLRHSFLAYSGFCGFSVPKQTCEK